MRSLRAFLSGVGVTCSAVLMVFPPAASAADQVSARGWGSPEVVVGPGCEPDAATAAAAAGPSGLVRGFASYVRGTCTGDPVWYFQGTAGRWVRARSPYHGDVLAVAGDNTGTWLLYLDGAGYDRVLLGRRLLTGRWVAPLVVSRLVGSAVGSGVQGASLVASGGRWWAVWAQALPDPESSSPPTTLFQAKTLGGTQAAHRITTAGTGYPQARPALALTSDHAGRPSGAVLAWTRDVGSRTTLVENDELWYASAGLAGRWTGRAVLRAAIHPYALSPVVTRDRCTTWLAWQRQSMDVEGPADSRVLVTDDPARAGTAHLFTAAGGGVVLTAAAGARSAALAWQSSQPGAVTVATRRAGRWTEQAVRVGTGRIPAQPLLIAAIGGRLTALAQLHGGDGRVVAVTVGYLPSGQAIGVAPGAAAVTAGLGMIKPSWPS